jgi:HTH-type transcriptional regulator/antitoxin HigA
MKPKIIRTESEYEAALQRVAALMDAETEPGSPKGEELDLLSLLVERYEDEHYPMDLPDPVAAIRFRMEQQGLKPKDLIPYLGSASKVSEVLSGRRGLSVAMIRNLVQGLGLPAEVLIGRPQAELAREPESEALQVNGQVSAMQAGSPISVNLKL